MNITEYNYAVELTNWFFIVFFAGTLLSSIINSVLDWMNEDKGNMNSNIKFLHMLHPLFKKFYPGSKIRKSLEYHRVSNGFSDLHTNITSGLTMACMMFGLVPLFLSTVMSWTGGNLWLSYVVIALVTSTAKTLLSLPFSFYDTFIIEGRFGFNNCSLSLFFIDTLKGFILSNLFMVASISILNYFLTSFGKYDSVSICMLVLGFTLVGYVFEFFYMTFGIRIFNKLTPLKDKNLLKRINNLFLKCGYKKVPNVMVMDASKRNSHGNAFIGGIGASKKIVLFDTLLENHTNDEILAILGHEIGHNSNHDLLKSRLYSILITLITTFIVFSFIYNPDIYHAFGFKWINDDNVVQYSLIGFNLSLMIIGSVRWILDPLESYISRRMEYKADAYSAEHVSSKSMISSLIKLSSDNLSDVFPDQMYEAWNYDHPSVINRVCAIMTLKENNNKNKKNKKTNKTVNKPIDDKKKSKVTDNKTKKKKPSVKTETKTNKTNSKNDKREGKQKNEKR